MAPPAFPPNFRIRLRPRGSVGYNLVASRWDACVNVFGGDRRPGILSRRWPKIEAPVADYPDLDPAAAGLRKIPRGSFGRHLLIYFGDADNNVCGRGR